RHEALDLEARLLGGRLPVAAREDPEHPLEAALLATPVEDELARRPAELAPRRLQAEATAPGEDGQGLPEVDRLPPRPGRERPSLERLPWVGHDQLGIQLEARAEPPAFRAGAVRVVEGEHAGRDLGERDPATDAGQPLGEDEGLAVRRRPGRPPGRAGC